MVGEELIVAMVGSSGIHGKEILKKPGPSVAVALLKKKK
jgi:hypothetical protein